MNKNIADEISKTMESIKDMKTQMSEINNYLSSLEGMLRSDYRKKIDGESYQRGLSEGNDIGYKDGVKDGRNEVWEAVRKIVISPDEGGARSKDLHAIFGNDVSMSYICRHYSASEVIEKLKAYEEKQKADDEIKVGDEIIDADDDVYIVTYIYGEKFDGFNLQTGMCREGVMLTSAKKTGRHFDFKSILEEEK